MISPLSRIFADYESLREYESGPIREPSVTIQQAIRRVIAIERADNPGKSDFFYEGLGALGIKPLKLQSMTDLMTALPCYFGDLYLFRKGDLLYVKSELFNEWIDVIIRIPPLWMIAGAMLKDFSLSEDQSRTNMDRFVEKMNLTQFCYSAMPAPYIPDLNYLVDKVHGIDDLHLHLNGTTETDVVWPYLLTHPYQIASQYEVSYRKSESVKKLSEQVMPGTTPNVVLSRLIHARELRNLIISVIVKTLHLSDNFNSVFVNLKYSSLSMAEFLSGSSLNFTSYKKWKNTLLEEIALYLYAMKLIERDDNQYLAGLLHHYMLIKGMIHRFLVMQQSQVGFSQFQLITDNNFRWDVERKYANRFKQLGGCVGKPFLRTVEGRFAPRGTSFENRLYVEEIVNGFEKAKKACPDLLQYAELKLIAHFIKRPDTKVFPSIRHHSLRAELKRKAVSLQMFKRRDANNFGKYVCGIDAAASEFDTRPEVFAAAYRYLRACGMEHFTFHAGEDFHHLLSGIRTIYEAIVFLGLKSGDRLGHCTAIGIKPRVWQKKVGDECYIPRGEWLDDLVFVWHLIKESRHPELQPVVLRLESEISSLALAVYGIFRHPSELTDAWLMRKVCPIPEFNEYKRSLLETPRYRREKLLEEISGRLGFQSWLDYYQVDPQLNLIPDSGIRARYDEIIKVKSLDLFGELDLEVVQQIVLKKISRDNIVIEALPSSNMHISFYDDLKEYHLMRWLNSDQSECMMPSVVLGSDDPGIFMTNIYNEYALAYLHFERCDYSPSKRMEKINSLRQFSDIYKF